MSRCLLITIAFLVACASAYEGEHHILRKYQSLVTSLIPIDLRTSVQVYKLLKFNFDHYIPKRTAEVLKPINSICYVSSLKNILSLINTLT